MAVVAKATYNVPATQNTAPVLEFRCLYTHDLFKKQKKWHDGSLKFHTFNRRVMVYDDVKNYIGDLHYRQDEEFGEGLELQLDRPVKVEVGEPIGRTETDLAPLLDRGRGERESRSTADVRRPVQRVPIASNSGKPRSLLDILGTSQGRHGRARMPLQSPYEQLHPTAEVYPAQPPAKKQKVAYGKENVQLYELQDDSQEPPARRQTSDLGSALNTRPRVIGPQTTAMAPDLNLATSATASRAQDTSSESADKSTGTHVIAAKITKCQKLTEVSSSSRRQQAKDSNNTREKQKLKKSKIQRQASLPESQPLIETPNAHERKKNPKKSKIRNQGDLPKPSSAIEVLDTHKKQQAKKSKIQNQPSSTKSLTATKASGKRPASEQSTAVPSRSATAKLRLHAPAPRQKLMYKALLLPGVDVRSSIPVPNPKNPSSRESRVARPVVKSVLLPHVEEVVPNEMPARYSSPHADVNDTVPALSRSPTMRSPQPRSCGPILISSSPMFVSQNASQMSHRTPPSFRDDSMDFILSQVSLGDRGIQKHAADDDRGRAIGDRLSPVAIAASNDSQIDVTCASEGPPTEVSSRSPMRETSRSPANEDPVATIVAANADVTSATSSPAKSVPAVIPPIPAEILPEKQAQQSLDQLGMTFPLDHARITTPRRPVQRNETVSSPPPVTGSPVKQLLQRTQSDTAALVQMKMSTPITVRPSQLLQPQKEDQGPWTKLEAFLLFDQWPAAKAKDKPVFGPPAQSRAGQQTPHTDQDFDGDGDDGIDEHVELSMDTNIRARMISHGPALRSILPSIRSARAVLRDEV